MNTTIPFQFSRIPSAPNTLWEGVYIDPKKQLQIQSEKLFGARSVLKKPISTIFLYMSTICFNILNQNWRDNVAGDHGPVAHQRAKRPRWPRRIDRLRRVRCLQKGNAELPLDDLGGKIWKDMAKRCGTWSHYIFEKILLYLRLVGIFSTHLHKYLHYTVDELPCKQWNLTASREWTEGTTHGR